MLFRSEFLAGSATNAAWEDAFETVSDPVPEEAWLGRYVFGATPFGLSELEVGSDRVRLCFGANLCEIPLAREHWQNVQFDLGKENDPYGYMSENAVRAARTEEELLLHICHTLTPFEDVLRVRFTAHGATVRWHRNVGFGNNEDLELIGRRE